MLGDFFSKTSPRIANAAEWRRTKELGRTRWLVWKGVLGFALEGLVLLHVILLLTGGRPWWSTSAAVNLSFLLLWVAGGILAAQLLWWQYERRYG